MRRLRAGLIGSISAWLPSRRSTAHHSGAVVIRLFGPGAVGQRLPAPPPRGTGGSGGTADASRAAGSTRAGRRAPGRDGVRSRLAGDETYASGEVVMRGAPGVAVGAIRRDRRTPDPRRGAGRSDPAAAAKEQAHHVSEGSRSAGVRKASVRTRPDDTRRGMVARSAALAPVSL